VHDDESNNIIRQIITQNPATLFVIFMSLANIHFDSYVPADSGQNGCSPAT
jgi:LuxR family capsular biosynthesis transcriptional activator